MDTNEAIRKLQQVKQVKKQSEANSQSNTYAKGLMNFKNIIVGAMSDLTGLILQNEPKVTVKNFPKGTTINNKKLSVEVTNFPKDKDVQRVEVTNQTKTVFDTQEINTHLKQISTESNKVPPLLQSSILGQKKAILSFTDYLKDIILAIKNIKLSPNITVKPADVKVDAPIVNIKETKIPPFPKKITAEVDMSALEDKIDELITETQYQTKVPITVANPGDFPVSTFNTKDLATSAKQLPDNHNVTVSNIDDVPLITGFATSTKQDDIIAKLPLNEVGRLKTSNLPADITPVTGTITANAQTIPVPTDRVSNVMAHCYGTFSTVNCTFEGSLNSTNGTDGNWFTIQAVRTNANTVETTTGNLSATPAYGWELSVNALRYMRVRATAFTSGTQNWVFTLGSYATEPIPAVQTHAVTVGSASTSIGKAEDGASASGNVGVPPMVVRADTLQASAGVSANGDYAFMFCDVDGRLYTNSMITGKTSDITYQTPRIDESTHTLQTIDYAHHEVHAGSSFYYHDVITLGNLGTQDYVITVPDTTKWPHFGLEIDYNDSAGITQIFEGTDKTGTTLQTVFNRNRNSLTAATTTIHKGQSGGTTDGTIIFWKRVGAGKTSGGIAGTAEERILKRNTKYIIRLSNTATTNNNVTVVFRWYEYINMLP